jgi:hypothetical protein
MHSVNQIVTFRLIYHMEYIYNMEHIVLWVIIKPVGYK